MSLQKTEFGFFVVMQKTTHA